MQHVKNNEHRTMIDFLELLNSIGYNIVSIDNTFYIFTAFQEVDDVINEIELTGKNATFLIENTVATAAANILKKNELISRIDEIPSRRRVFHPNTLYVKYLSS